MFTMAVFFLFFFQSFYSDQFGPEVIEMIKDSNTVEKEKLSPDKVDIKGPHYHGCRLAETISILDKTSYYKVLLWSLIATRFVI